MLTVKFDTRSALDGLQGVLWRLSHLSPLLKEMGDDLIHSTMERFRTGTAPDGTQWEPNRPVTIQLYQGMFADAGSKKPLVGETRDLAGKISWQLDGDAAVEVGSPMPYANMQQFGGTKAQWPHLWGDIPARPFLGISNNDEETILKLVHSYLAQ